MQQPHSVRASRNGLGKRVGVGTAILALGRVAAAEPESVRIDYVAPPGAPTRPPSCAHCGSARPVFARQPQTSRHGGSSCVWGRWVSRSPAASRFVAPTAELRFATWDASHLRPRSRAALASIAALTIDRNALTGGPKAAGESPAEPRQGPHRRPSDSAPFPFGGGCRRVGTVRPRGGFPTVAMVRGPAGEYDFSGTADPGLRCRHVYRRRGTASSTLGPAVRMGIFLNQSDVESRPAPPPGSSGR